MTVLELLSEAVALVKEVMMLNQLHNSRPFRDNDDGDFPQHFFDTVQCKCTIFVIFLIMQSSQVDKSNKATKRRKI